jgi:hypothetical protein
VGGRHGGEEAAGWVGDLPGSRRKKKKFSVPVVGWKFACLCIFQKPSARSFGWWLVADGWC